MQSKPRTSPLNLPQFTKNSESNQGKSSDSVYRTASPWITTTSSVCGLYVHVPFCFHKCHYCDFFSIVGDEDAQERFVDRLLFEFQTVGQHIRNPIETIFIGGGTPTLLEDSLLSSVLEGITTNFTFADGFEWSVEANPETVTPEKAKRLFDGGVNRVSIGAQSFDKECLKALERWHDPESVPRSVNYLRQAGFENLNLDLIFGIPGQTLQVFRSDLQKTVDLNPEHISSYALTYEPNTPLTIREQRGDVQKIDEDLELQMFEETMSILSTQGYEQYEISNYAKPDRECAHNLLYWNNGSWWPMGPAAAGHVDGRRWRNVPRLSQYNAHDGLPLVEDIELLSESSQAGETLMLGLRLREGISKERVQTILAVKDGAWRVQVIEHYLQEGLLALSPNLQLTTQGILLADTIIGDLLMEPTPMVDTSKQENNG